MALPDAIKVFRSTDVGAPNVVGAAGSLVAFLNAILSDGYNSRSVASITVAGGIATLTVGAGGAHGFIPGQVIAISGANESLFNNEFVTASSPTGTTLTFTAPAGAPASATGTITVKQASLNFEKLFTSSSPANWATYRSTDLRSNKPILNVDGTSAYWTKVRMYESMTAYNAGINGDQSLASAAGSASVQYGTWQQGVAADALTKPWIAFGNSRAFYIFMKWGVSNALWVAGEWWGFGEFKSYRQNDFYNTFMLASFSQNLGSSPGQQFTSSFGLGTGIQAHLALMRTGFCLQPQSGPGLKSGMHASSSQSTWNSGNIGATFPSFFGSQIITGPIIINEQTGSYLRGILPGLHAIYNVVTLEEIILPCADYPGRTMQVLKYANGGATWYNIIADLTGPWTMPS